MDNIENTEESVDKLVEQSEEIYEENDPLAEPNGDKNISFKDKTLQEMERTSQLSERTSQKKLSMAEDVTEEKLERKASALQLVKDTENTFESSKSSFVSLKSTMFPDDHLDELYFGSILSPGQSEVYKDTMSGRVREDVEKQPLTEHESQLCEENKLKEAEEATPICTETCIPFVDPFKCYVKTESIEKLELNAQVGIKKKQLPIITLNDVVCHNTEDDCWVVINGIVRNLTYLIKEYKKNCQYDLVKPILANAGKDISVWFNRLTGDIQHFVHPITGVCVPYIPHGRIPDVGLQVPSTKWEALKKKPWWKDTSNIVAVITKQQRPIRILNMLCGVEVTMPVCCEDTITRIQDKYMERYNWHAKSYTWKYDKRVLEMDLTLDENGIPDESKLFVSIGLPESTYIPCLMIYFNDDLTEI